MLSHRQNLSISFCAITFTSSASLPALIGRYAAVYSEVQNSRLDHSLPLPAVLKTSFKVIDGPPSSAAGNPDGIAKLFPCMFGQPSAMLVSDGLGELPSGQNLKIGVVLSGGQAPRGHNVIAGIFDYLQERCKGSTLYGFRGGLAGVMKCKYVVLTLEYIYPHRNQGRYATTMANVLLMLPSSTFKLNLLELQWHLRVLWDIYPNNEHLISAFSSENSPRLEGPELLGLLSYDTNC